MLGELWYALEGTRPKRLPLYGPFKESHSGGDGFRHVNASDWDTEALLIILRIIHGRNRQVPRSLDLDMLAETFCHPYIHL
ncbi:hypothetical protein EV127DRAFT_40277 [Xylaria flabelliformis]|nr:hypothetical protein EV127DRAFT_40277 [Xylaria flabelliformis]